MHQTDNIEDLARELGIDSGTSDSQADRLRTISEAVGMDDYNSLYDNNKLEENLKKQRDLQNGTKNDKDDYGSYLKDIEKQRNLQNNTKNAKAAVDIAANSGHPVAEAIGKSAQAADKLTNGKATEMMGKRLPKSAQLPGPKNKKSEKQIQNLSNMLAESGMTDRIAKAVNMKNRTSGNPNGSSPSTTNPNSSLNAGGSSQKKKGLFGNLGLGTEGTSKRETEEKFSDFGGQEMQITMKIIKYGLIACIPIIVVVVFVCLFLNASQVVKVAIGLEDADKVADNEAEEKIKENGSEGLDDPDDNYSNTDDTDSNGDNDDNDDNDEVSYIFNLNSLNFMYTKLKGINTVEAKTQDQFSDSDILELEDHYSDLLSFGDQGYDMNMVYKFFFKLHYIYKYYLKNYRVTLDIPLLMSTLNVQSSDVNIVFSSNIVDYKVNLKENNPLFSYDYDWSSYVTKSNVSTHDIEVLAQHMVSKQAIETCVSASGEELDKNILKDNEVDSQVLTCTSGTYKKTSPTYEIDNDKYKEFLLEFLEKKYYINDDIPIDGNNSNNQSDENNDSNNESPSEKPDEENNNQPVPSQGPYSTWKQCGESWSDIIVPNSKSNMCKIGCLITSVTIQIARSNTLTVVSPIDPGVAVKKFSFVSGGNFVYDSARNLAPNFRFYTIIKLSGMNRESVAKKLLSYDPNKYYIILAVSKIERNKVHHYVALDYVDSNDYKLYMMDPARTNTSDVYSVYKVYEAVIYEKRD